MEKEVPRTFPPSLYTTVHFHIVYVLSICFLKEKMRCHKISLSTTESSFGAFPIDSAKLLLFFAKRKNLFRELVLKPFGR